MVLKIDVDTVCEKACSGEDALKKVILNVQYNVVYSKPWQNYCPQKLVTPFRSSAGPQLVRSMLWLLLAVMVQKISVLFNLE